MHKAFLQEHRPGQYSALLLSGKLWTYLADLDEQAADWLAFIVSQMQEAEGVTEELKARDHLAWVGAMNSIRSREEEIVLAELVYLSLIHIFESSASCGASFSVSRRKLHDRECCVTSFRQGGYPPLRR